jgi:membrane protein
MGGGGPSSGVWGAGVVRACLLQRPYPMDRIEAWASARSARIRGYNPWLVSVLVVRRFMEVRVLGLGAEMAYFALVSTLPLVATLGATMGTLERVLGAERVGMLEDFLVDALARVFSPDLTATVMAPLVRGLLAEERAGFAIGGLLITLWLAGGAFRAATRALDDAYQVPERRGAVSQWVVAYGLTVGAVVGVVLLVSLVVVGPLLGGGHRIADWFGLGSAFAMTWDIVRWLVVFAGAVVYLVWVYRVAPNVQNGWRDCVPGAFLATVLILLITVGFQTYLEVAGPTAPSLGDADAAVQMVSLTIAAVLATVLWVWLVSIAVLTGGVLNAELDRSRGIRRPTKA